MTPQDWKDIEYALGYPYGRARLPDFDLNERTGAEAAQ